MGQESDPGLLGCQAQDVSRGCCQAIGGVQSQLKAQLREGSASIQADSCGLLAGFILSPHGPLHGTVSLCGTNPS